MNEEFLELVKENLKSFYKSHYSDKIESLTLLGTKEEISELRKGLEGNIIGSHAIFCKTEIENDNSGEKYKLKIGFSKI
jgi:hypothetical protein